MADEHVLGVLLGAGEEGEGEAGKAGMAGDESGVWHLLQLHRGDLGHGTGSGSRRTSFQQ